MAGTLNYLFDPNQHVYVIVDTQDPHNANSKVPAIRPGKVVRVRFDVLVTETTLVYDIAVDRNPGTTPLSETDVFTDLAAAVIEYETRL